MKLTTPVSYQYDGNLIEPSDKILSIGSCFSDNIGSKLQEHKFLCLSNPFGTLFNPISIAKNIKRSLEGEMINPQEVDELNGRFFHYDFHTSFNGNAREEVTTRINTSLRDTSRFLSEVDWLIITLGTAIAYRKKSDNGLVANCHKVPAGHFEKYWIPIEEVVSALSEVVTAIRRLRPALNVIFTVSPVRHIKEGLPQNQRSKARLIEAGHRIVETLDKVHYFPAYEMMMDEWRDYRFYKEDMIHPSSQAVDAIWARFQHDVLSVRSREKVGMMEQINRAMLHRPFKPSSDAHQQFLKTLEKKKAAVKRQFPEVRF